MRGLNPGGVVVRDERLRPRTGGWRVGIRPELDRARCVDCLLCWLYCPDSAILLDGTSVTGIGLDLCKGCELCAVACPTGAIEMVAE